MQTVILAGGLATRLRPITQTIPKSMVPVLGTPFLQLQLELLKRRGVSDVVLCVGHLWEQIQTYFGDGDRFGVRLRYSVETRTLLGTAGALKQAEPLLQDRFLLMYGDSYLAYDYADVLESAAGEDAVMVVYHNKGLYDTSNVELEGDRVVCYEKGRSDLEYIDAGLSALRKNLVQTLPEGRSASLDSDLFPALVESRRLKAYVTDQRFFEIGSPDGLAEFTELYSAGSLPL